jgi:GNAT superfamily N-acetyltransferase
LTLGLFHGTDYDDGTLLAMIHGTRTSSTYASDPSMAIGGHEPDGTTVGIHTLCVHPGWRAKGLGTRILKEYINRVAKEKGVERVALISHDGLVPFYER